MSKIVTETETEEQKFQNRICLVVPAEVQHFSSRIILDEPEIFCKFYTSKLFNAFFQQPKSSDETLSIKIFRLMRLTVNTFSLIYWNHD
jgi:hypothetical protein